MELTQLTYFLAVAEEGGFSAGARRVHVVQSTVSAAVARLERELGQPLFERTSRHTELTAAGRVLRDHARTLLAQVRAAREDLDSLRAGATGSVVLGALLSSGSIDLPQLLRRFNAEHPGVAVSIRHLPGAGHDHLDALSDGRIDLALVVAPERPPPWVRVDLVGQIGLTLVCAAFDPLAGQREVPLVDLAERTFVDFPAGWGNRRAADAAFSRVGATRSVAFEVTDVGAALALIAQGIGIGFVPREAFATRPDIAPVELADPPEPDPLALLSDRRRPRGAAVRALHATLTDLAGTTAGDPS